MYASEAYMHNNPSTLLRRETAPRNTWQEDGRHVRKLLCESYRKPCSAAGKLPSRTSRQ